MTLSVPGNVDEYVELRHSVSPAFDCSSGAPLGPYEGLRPHCAAGQRCTDYDYSLAPAQAFPTRGGGSLLGADIGHCEVPMVGAVPILDALSGTPFTSYPPQVPVQP